MAPADIAGMSSYPIKIITDRQAVVANEINTLKMRIATLESELDELDRAAAVLDRLARESGIAPHNNAATLFEPPANATSDALSPKPPGTPTMTDMILEALERAHKAGADGLQPAGLVDYIRKRYWPDVQVANVGPIAWRMWKRSQLGKDGSIYFRLDRPSLYRRTHNEQEAPTELLVGTS